MVKGSKEKRIEIIKIKTKTGYLQISKRHHFAAVVTLYTSLDAVLFKMFS